jgi:hypothetical protein
MEKEALDLVASLNNETYIDGISLDYYNPFEFRSTGNECGIYFLSFILWTEDNDEREWKTEHEKESLRQYVLRESNKILSDLNQRMRQV